MDDTGRGRCVYMLVCNVVREWSAWACRAWPRISAITRVASETTVVPPLPFRLICWAAFCLYCISGVRLMRMTDDG